MATAAQTKKTKAAMLLLAKAIEASRDGKCAQARKYMTKVSATGHLVDLKTLILRTHQLVGARCRR